MFKNFFQSSGASNASDNYDDDVLDVQGSNASQGSYSDVDEYCPDVEKEDNVEDE